MLANVDGGAQASECDLVEVGWKSRFTIFGTGLTVSLLLAAYLARLEGGVGRYASLDVESSVLDCFNADRSYHRVILKSCRDQQNANTCSFRK